MQKVFIEFVFDINGFECRIQVPPNTPIETGEQVANLFLAQLKNLRDQAEQKESEKEGE